MLIVTCMAEIGLCFTISINKLYIRADYYTYNVTYCDTDIYSICPFKFFLYALQSFAIRK